MHVGFEWDPRKNRSNLRKHGIDFRDAILAFDTPYLEGPDDRHDYGEERMIVYGRMGPHVIALVYVWRRGRRRVITARKATTAETRKYLEAIYE